MTISNVVKLFSDDYPQSITYCSIQDAYLSEFHQALNLFRKNAEAYLETQDFMLFYEKLKRIRNELCAYVKVYNVVVEEENLLFIQNEFKIKYELYSELKEYLKRIERALNNLIKQNSGAIIQYLDKNVIKERNETYCVVTKRDMKKIDKQTILRIFFRFKLTILSESDFRSSDRFYDSVVFIGNENYFHTATNNSTRAKKIFYVCQSIYQNKFSDSSLFIDWEGDILSTIYKGIKVDYQNFHFGEEEGSTDKGNLIEGEKLDSMEEEGIKPALAAEMLIGAETSQFNETPKSLRIKAQLFELEDPYLVFLRKSTGSKDVLDKNGEFRRKQILDIRVGDYLIWSSVNGKDEIEAYADYLFKNKGIIHDRVIQQKIKKSIAKFVDKHSVKKLCKVLKSRGMVNISETKIKHLMLPSSFKLQNNKEFWQLLFILTKGDEKQTRACYEASRRLSAYHISAGRILRRRMRDKIMDMDILHDSEKELRINIEKEFYVTLTWYRINYINSEAVTIPEIYEGKLININQLEGVAE